MKVKREYAGEYVVTLNDGRKFGLSKDGGAEYPWNIHEWDNKRDCPDYCKAPYGSYETKREALEQLAFEEKEELDLCDIICT